MIESSAFSQLEILILGPCFSYRPRGKNEEMLYLVRMETISLAHMLVMNFYPSYILFCHSNRLSNNFQNTSSLY